MASDSDTSTVTSGRFTRRVGLFTIGTLISRLLGVARESVFAYLFGAGMATDAFNVAFRIPNFLRDLFAESALSAAFVPTFVSRRQAGDERRTWRFAANMFNTIALFIGLLVILGMIFAPQVVQVIAWGFRTNPEKLALTTTLTRIMFPFLLFVVLAAWAMGILNACGSFFIPASAPAAFNLFSALLPIALYGFLRQRGVEPITGMAYGVTLGAVAQLVVQLPRLRTFGFRYQPVLDLRDSDLHQVVRRWVPMILGFASWQVNFLVNTLLLTFLPQGSVTWVSYAYRIQHLPAGLFGVAIGTVALAEYSGSAATERCIVPARFNHALKLAAVLTLPAGVLLLVLAVPVVRLVYEHGRFTPFDTMLTAQALALYALGVLPAALTRNCAAGFYALGDTKTPALVALGVVAGNIVLNLILMRFIGFRSFPLAASFTSFLNFLLLFYLLMRRQPNLGDRTLLGMFCRTLFAALIGGALALGSRFVYESFLPINRVVFQLVEVIITGGFGLIGYYLMARILHIDEVKEAIKSLIQRGG
ncbi:murein biosynthesis integral membrane protein MurJ [candidate division WOR-3 bacterium]|nr:murein biosynthesis integral membrane protein MurJ [candidate division WOR-3 bacterium]